MKFCYTHLQVLRKGKNQSMNPSPDDVIHRNCSHKNVVFEAKKRVAPKWRHFWYKRQASKLPCLRTHAMILQVDISGSSNLYVDKNNVQVESCVKGVLPAISMIVNGV